MKLDKTRPYGTITGHAIACFEQDGVLFDGAGYAIEEGEVAKKDPKIEEIIETAEVSSAETFLKNILSGGPLSKSVVYQTSQNNNQLWQDINAAAVKMNILKFQFKGQETWKLPDTVAV